MASFWKDIIQPAGMGCPINGRSLEEERVSQTSLYQAVAFHVHICDLLSRSSLFYLIWVLVEVETCGRWVFVDVDVMFTADREFKKGVGGLSIDIIPMNNFKVVHE